MFQVSSQNHGLFSLATLGFSLFVFTAKVIVFDI
jgi:hypothetical protein